MSLFLETIKINNGRRINLEGHNRRMNTTRNRHFHEIRDIDLRDQIQVPQPFKQGIVKCKVVYGRKIESIEFEPYFFRNPRSFCLVEVNQFSYNYKNLNRKELHLLFEQRGSVDDIIIVKEDKITDSYYANLVFLKKGQWYTPSFPLLNGTQRQKLIANGTIQEKDINIHTIYEFEEIKIINAMTEWSMHSPVLISSQSIKR